MAVGGRRKEKCDISSSFSTNTQKQPLAATHLLFPDALFWACSNDATFFFWVTDEGKKKVKAATEPC